MPALSRLLGPVAAMILVVAPIGNATILLVVATTLNMRLAAIVVREVLGRKAAAAAALDDQRQLQLRRRTIPQLRARRPFGVIEAQVRWRQAAEARRRSHASGEPITR
jgi:hypothetical protein